MPNPLEDYIVDMTPRATLRAELPGSEGKYFCEAAQFNTTGRAIYDSAIREADGSVVVAILSAGLIDFLLPGKDKQGNPVDLGFATFASNRKVYESLVSAPALYGFLVSQVSKLNPEIFREMSAEEREELTTALEEQREELETLREIEGEAAPLDRNGSSGSPACSSEDAAEPPSACSTPSSAPA